MAREKEARMSKSEDFQGLFCARSLPKLTDPLTQGRVSFDVMAVQSYSQIASKQ